MIQPNTIIHLLKGVYFDADYANTVRFRTEQEQTNSMLSKNKITLNNYTYQRVSKNKIRIDKTMEEVIDYNYMMFKNTSYENKWFYAFIVNVEYINDRTTELTYMIDVIQTWFLFNCVVEECFVEREHSLTDNIGDSITAEPVEIGEYIFDGYSKLSTDFDFMSVIMAITDTDDFGVYKYDNNICGSKLYCYPVDATTIIQAKLANYIQQPEAVTAMYLCPTKIINETDIESTSVIKNNAKGVENYYTKEPITGTETFGNYRPRNKKLYTYPYNFLHIDNANGNSLALRYEFFENLTPEFNMWSNFTYPPSINIAPHNYKKQGDTTIGNRTETLTINNYPMCSWSNDAYKNWLSTEVVPIAISAIHPLAQILGGGVQTIAGIGALGASATGGVANPMMISEAASMISGGLSSASNGGQSLSNLIANTLIANYKASIKADVLRGSSSIGNANIASNENIFHYARCHVTEEYAKIIDSYFNKFGYSCNKVKVPNFSSRPYWNYVKTIGAEVFGDLPNIYLNQIKAILDRGITFWHIDGTIGNYSLDNSPQ